MTGPTGASSVKARPGQLITIFTGETGRTPPGAVTILYTDMRRSSLASVTAPLRPRGYRSRREHRDLPVPERTVVVSELAQGLRPATHRECCARHLR